MSASAMTVEDGRGAGRGCGARTGRGHGARPRGPGAARARRVRRSCSTNRPRSCSAVGDGACSRDHDGCEVPDAGRATRRSVRCKETARPSRDPLSASFFTGWQRLRCLRGGAGGRGPEQGAVRRRDVDSGVRGGDETAQRAVHKVEPATVSSPAGPAYGLLTGGWSTSQMRCTGDTHEHDDT